MDELRAQAMELVCHGRVSDPRYAFLVEEDLGAFVAEVCAAIPHMPCERAWTDYLASRS